MTTWQNLEGRLASGAAAASWGELETQVFALHEDGELWNRYWDGERWHEWESLGGSFAGQPAASARGADRIDLFAIGTDGTLKHRFFDGSRWVDWSEVPEAPANTRAVACSWIGDRLDVFVWDSGGALSYAALSV